MDHRQERSMRSLAGAVNAAGWFSVLINCGVGPIGGYVLAVSSGVPMPLAGGAAVLLAFCGIAASLVMFGVAGSLTVALEAYEDARAVRTYVEDIHQRRSA